jgi:hypothetical protein
MVVTAGRLTPIFIEVTVRWICWLIRSENTPNQPTIFLFQKTCPQALAGCGAG